MAAQECEQGGTFAYGTRRNSSSVAPDFETMTTKSSRPTMPMSPCSASVGFRKTAFVPVDTSVWHTFCAMKPLLPMPVSRMEPLQSRHACANVCHLESRLRL